MVQLSQSIGPPSRGQTTRVPAEELLVTAGGQYTVAGQLPGEREVTSDLNNPRVEHDAVADAVVQSARYEAESGSRAG